MTDGGANPGVVLDVWFPKPELDGVETAETVVLDAENTLSLIHISEPTRPY